MFSVKLKQIYEKKKETFGELMDDLKCKFKEVYNIGPILEIIEEFKCQKLSSEQASEKISSYLRNEVREERKSELKITFERVIQLY